MKKLNRTEWQIQCAFNAFCKNVLKNAATDIHRERLRRQSKEKNFSELAPHEENQLYSLDDYNKINTEDFIVTNKRISPELLADALKDLSEDKSQLILLYYFSHLSDREISEQLNVPRRTVHYRRNSALKLLIRFLEAHADEWDGE